VKLHIFKIANELPSEVITVSLILEHGVTINLSGKTDIKKQFNVTQPGRLKTRDPASRDHRNCGD